MNNNLFLALGTYFFLFVLIWICVKLGYQLGLLRKAQTSPNQLGIVKVAEGTVFALLGLLMAFSFSGAYQRFEYRKFKIIEEVNAIETVYRRIDLLNVSTQQNLRNLIKQYVDQRIATYLKMGEFRGFESHLNQAKQLQNIFWQNSIEALKLTNNHEASLLLIPAINDMFDVANTRIMITQIHPPLLIFFLLFGLGGLSGFLVGYSMAKHQVYNSVYIFCFIAITAFTIYLIVDLEFPRIGLIRIDAFDHLLLEARENLN